MTGADTLPVYGSGHGPGTSYATRRGALETYFDRTARDAWEQLTSHAPVSRIRATVRAGRDRMRSVLLSWLGDDLTEKRLLDAGCGTGALAVEAAGRGAQVLAIDLAAGLVDVARERAPHALAGAIDFRVGDMLDPALGAFDAVAAMDSLIHYEPEDVVRVLCAIAPRTHRAIVFTFAPATPALRLMHVVGRLFPRTDRAPEIVPISPQNLFERLGSAPELRSFRLARTVRIVSGFYTSQAVELVRI